MKKAIETIAIPLHLALEAIELIEAIPEEKRGMKKATDTIATPLHLALEEIEAKEWITIGTKGTIEEGNLFKQTKKEEGNCKETNKQAKKK